MPAQPRRPKTPLESLLNEAQRKRLGDFLTARISSIDSQLMEFRKKRRIYEMQMNDNFTWRSGGRSLDYFKSSMFDEWSQTIFDKQNDSLNIVGGFAAFITARAIDDFFGTDPFFSVMPEGTQDNILAASIQKHSEWKLRMCPWKDSALDAIDCAIGLGEGVMKQSWRREIDEFESDANVLMDASTGVEVTGPDGDYVYGPDENGNGADEVSFVSAMDETGTPKIMMVVAKYPQTDEYPGMILDAANLAFQMRTIPKVNVRYNNVTSSTVHFADLLVPETEDNLEDSPFVGQRTQMRLSDLDALYHLDEDVYAQLQTDTHDAKTEAAKPDNERGEFRADDYPYEDNPDPLIELVECWIRHDPVGDRKQRRMYVLFAPAHDLIVTMDYMGNVTPEGVLPFQVIRAFKVKNRWYGRGYFEIYEKAQEFIDRHLNYVAHRNRFHANPITFFDPSNLMEDEETKEFVLEPGKTYRLKPNLKAEDVFQIMNMPDLDQRTWQLMQMMIQIVQVRSGITSAAQGEVSSLPSTSTATGIESILQSASTLARQPMNLMKGGLEKALLYSLKLIYANMDRDEIYSYMEGDQQMVGTLDAISVKKLEMNVRLTLTRFQKREALDATEKLIPLMQFWLAVPEQEKGPIRPGIVQGVKALGFDNAEAMVRQQAQMDPATGQMFIPGNAGGPPQPFTPPGLPGTPGAMPGGAQGGQLTLPMPRPQPSAPAGGDDFQNAQ